MSETKAGREDGFRALSYLISGLVFYGGLGWLGDSLLHTRFLLPTGLIVGMVAGVYLVIRKMGDLGGPKADDSKRDSEEKQ